MADTLFPATDSPPDQNGWFVAHCDGGSRGNPGPAGFGAVIEDPDRRVVARLSEFLGHQTNNYAEYAGLLAVIKWALANEVKRLRVFSDSELMVRQIKGIYRVSSPTLLPMREQACRLGAQLDKFEITHTLRGGNREADRLANQAMDRGMKTSGASTAVAAIQPEVFEGLVKDGVVHLIDGELPDGTLVKVSKK